MATKKVQEWGDAEIETPSVDFLLPGVTDPAGTPLDKRFGRKALNNLLPATITGAGTALTKTHWGRAVVLSGSGTITINIDNLADGWNCFLINTKGSDYTFPTATGAGVSQQGPTNGDTKIKNNAGCTVMLIGTKIYWFPTESAA